MRPTSSIPTPAGVPSSRPARPSRAFAPRAAAGTARGRSVAARLGRSWFAAAAVLAACVPAGDGIAPPTDQLYFPVALAVDESSEWLYVVNSDFDLQFNGGTVQSVRLGRLREIVPRVCSSDAHCEAGEICDVGQDASGPTADNGGTASFFCVPNRQASPCGDLREQTPSERAVAPGRCAPISLLDPPDGGGSLLEQVVTISAFATDAVLRTRPAGEEPGAPQRLFIPVRSDRSLHWIDVDGGALDCGQERDGGSCDAKHRVGDNPDAETEERSELPTEPFGIDATEDGRVLVVAHQVGGRVSAFTNDWANGPRLAYVESGLPNRPIGVAAVPPRLLSEGSVAEQAPGFLVTFRNAAQVNLLRFLGEDDSRRSRLVDVAETPLTVNTLGVDSRGIAIDDPRPRARAVCDELPAEERDGCLAEAERLPLDVYVANRTPPSLIVGRTREVTATGEPRDLPTFHDSIPLTAGPSRVVVGNVLVDDGTPEGRPERRIFVLCFDSNLIYVYDPEERRIEAEISTGRGPHALAFDRERPLAYVAHFTDSYIGVVSLDQRSPWNYGALIASIGTPRPPRASK